MTHTIHNTENFVKICIDKIIISMIDSKKIEVTMEYEKQVVQPQSHNTK